MLFIYVASHVRGYERRQTQAAVNIWLLRSFTEIQCPAWIGKKAQCPGESQGRVFGTRPGLFRNRSMVEVKFKLEAHLYTIYIYSVWQLDPLGIMCRLLSDFCSSSLQPGHQEDLI